MAPNSAAEVKSEIYMFHVAVLNYVMWQSDRFLDMYVDVLDGSAGAPDEVVLVEAIHGERDDDYGCSEEAEAEREEARFIHENYYDNHWDLLRCHIRAGLLERGREIDPHSEKGIEIKERLKDRELWMYGVHL